MLESETGTMSNRFEKVRETTCVCVCYTRRGYCIQSQLLLLLYSRCKLLLCKLSCIAQILDSKYLCEHCARFDLVLIRQTFFSLADQKKKKKIYRQNLMLYTFMYSKLLSVAQVVYTLLARRISNVQTCARHKTTSYTHTARA